MTIIILHKSLDKLTRDRKSWCQLDELPVAFKITEYLPLLQVAILPAPANYMDSSITFTNPALITIDYFNIKR